MDPKLVTIWFSTADAEVLRGSLVNLMARTSVFSTTDVTEYASMPMLSPSKLTFTVRKIYPQSPFRPLRA